MDNGLEFRNLTLKTTAAYTLPLRPCTLCICSYLSVVHLLFVKEVFRVMGITYHIYFQCLIQIIKFMKQYFLIAFVMGKNTIPLEEKTPHYHQQFCVKVTKGTYLAFEIIYLITFIPNSKSLYVTVHINSASSSLAQWCSSLPSATREGSSARWPPPCGRGHLTFYTKNLTLFAKRREQRALPLHHWPAGIPRDHGGQPWHWAITRS